LKRSAFILTAAVCTAAVGRSAPVGDPPSAFVAMADALFVSGQFAQAQGIYALMLKRSSRDGEAMLRIGQIDLYSNRLDAARTSLEKAINLMPDATEAKVLLAETLYRQDDFSGAAKVLRSAGPAAASLPTMDSYSTLIVSKLESFGTSQPNGVIAPGERTVLKFIKTDPLPIVHVKVNGKDAVFFIDTGGAEAIIDTHFAKELKIPQYAATAGLFAGGQGAAVGSGKIESLTLGQWTVRNVPVQIIDTRAFSSAFGVQIDGCIGTVVLARFLTTLDYQNGQLILQPRSASLPKKRSTGSVIVPFWLTGDHVIVAFGAVNQLPPSLFLVDSGMTSGVNLRQSMFKAAHIQLDEAKAADGRGGAGALRTVPYVAANVSLGDWHEENVPGEFDGPQAAEDKFGFFVQGLVGHEFLKPHIVTFDFVAMEMLIQ
jgi:hypothetical protein